MGYHQVPDPVEQHALLDAAIESDLDVVALFEQIVSSAVRLTDARYGALAMLDPDGTGLSEFVHVGMDPTTVEAIGHWPAGLGILGQLMASPHPMRVAELSEHPRAVGFPPVHPPMRSFLGVPINVRGQVVGNLYLTDKARRVAFSAEDEQLLVALASTAAIAVDNARLHGRVRELTLAEDRERIARDLHDTVIQRLFAVALSLQAAGGVSQEPEVGHRLNIAVEDLDETIRQIHTAIFALGPTPTGRAGLRAQALHICAEAARSLGSEPEVHFSGPVDLVVHPVGTEALATLREALSNVARHSHARQVKVSVAGSADDLCLEVSDDGVGPAASPQGVGRGLSNMAERAEALGGSFSLSARPGGGTRLVWRVPIT
ncbi:MAG: GAF domain-containing sensor histidine kinase [Actinomycetota bacterium]|nr:GAF domain-containing sensor histidine kinase [Actinomycetota bacterium]